jgi:hypothetical protein
MTSPPSSLACVLVALAAAPPARAAGETVDWVHIGDPGNRAPNETEAPFLHPAYRFGAVAHEFEITETPVTVEEWLPFVRAYAPFTDERGDSFVSTWIRERNGEFELSSPQVARFPANVTVTYAARYMNWLHNGQVNEAWAFESGVYDTTGWVEFPQGEPEDWGITFDTNPNARYRLPTPSELTKALYYDPDRYGEGEGGYWMYPDGGDDALISGLPVDGGETNAGLAQDPTIDFFLPVEAYPHVRSPYGLTDVSGGESELTWQLLEGDDHGHFTAVMGSSWGLGPEWDELRKSFTAQPIWAGNNSFRIVRRVPAPSVVCLAAPLLVTTGGRRRSR